MQFSKQKKKSIVMLIIRERDIAITMLFIVPVETGMLISEVDKDLHLVYLI